MTETMTTAFTTAITGIQTDAVGMAEKALPVALGLFAVGFGIRWAMNFFRSLAH